MGASSSRSGDGDGAISSDVADEGIGEGLVTVGTARTPEQAREETAEAAIVRKLRALRPSKPLLSWRRSDVEALEEDAAARRRVCGAEAGPATPTGSPNRGEGVRPRDQAATLEGLQRDVDGAFATATAWYSAQASMVTRRQFALHADMLDAGALSQRCLSTMQRARSALVRSARHAPADLAALSSDLAALVAHAEHLERGLRRVDESLEVHRANLQGNLHSASPVRGP